MGDQERGPRQGMEDAAGSGRRAGTEVFVYGSLKRGGRLHRYLERAEFLGAGATEPGWTLYNVGAFPAMVREEGTAGVIGEVFRVDEETLRRLDAVERVPALYRREPVRLAEGPVTQAEGYVWNSRPLTERVGSEWVRTGDRW
jgi:gamma-glutamylcyclotransferase (GGCT)/AIG2-like uncharacterized protein YtfP